MIEKIVGLITIATTAKCSLKKFKELNKRRKIKRFIIKNKNNKISVVKLMKQFEVEQSVVEEIFNNLKKKYVIEYQRWYGGTIDTFFEDYYIIK